MLLSMLLVLMLIFVFPYPLASGGNVVCPGKKEECPAKYTCCMTSGDHYSCCPFSSAVCCPDQKHCCPANHTCNDKTHKCDGKQPRKQHQYPIPFNVCPVGEQPCQLPLGEMGCIGRNGVCCSRLGKLNCTDNFTMFEEGRILVHRPLIPTGRTSVSCPGGNTTCNENNTCCKNTNGGYGCCPVASATCCADLIHCCPPGTTCDLEGHTCREQQQQKQVASPKPLVQNHPKSFMTLIQRPYMTDLTSSDKCGKHMCLSGETCCTTTSNSGCCPLRDASCCPDGKHCCPERTTCNDKNQCISFQLD